MERNKIKNLVAFGLMLIVNLGYGQGNPGFLGKKIALGYTIHYSIANTAELGLIPKGTSHLQILTNNDIYAEYSIKKHSSVAAHFSMQLVPVSSSSYVSRQNNDILAQYFTINGVSTRVNINRLEGTADIRMIGLGLRYTDYFSAKSISAPIGIGHYFRFDMYMNKAVGNYFKYGIEDYNNDFTDIEKTEMLKKLDKGENNKATSTFNLGYGIESKMPITAAVYFRLNAEFNFSLNIIKKGIASNSYSSDNFFTPGQELSEMGKSLINYRNMLLIGMGVGVLL